MKANIIPVKSYLGMNAKKNSSERVVNHEVLIANYVIEHDELLYPVKQNQIVQTSFLTLQEQREKMLIEES